MATISTAVGLDRISRVSGYKIKKGIFNTSTPNLPQLIAVFGEANSANQSGLTATKREVTSAQEAGELYGFGSPIHQQMRILRPVTGEGVGGIPTIVFPQVSAGGATETEREWTVTGTATSNSVHTLILNGRTGVDFQSYSYSVVTGDTPTIIAGKMADAVNAVLGSPATAVAALGVVTFTTKWAGATAAEFNVSVDNGGNSAGVSYSETSSTDGTGIVTLADSFSQFGDDWYTICTNPYGEAHLATFEQFNGVPDINNPTGRYEGIIFKPFMAYFGSVLSDKDDIVAITDDSARVEQVTNVLCPAPNSAGFTWEAAANVVYLVAPTFQNTPNLDVNNMAYPDMPIPADRNIGDMANYNDRDFLVKNGSSTVILENAAYGIQDLVTTYHPSGEVPLQYSYARNLNLDFNVKDVYTTLERIFLRDKTLVADNQTVSVSGAVKPKEFKAIVNGMFDELAEEALINDPQFSKDSLQMQISDTNPNRIEATFRYKRTGIARIQSTDVEAGF